jgi:hypothetical protein
MNSEHTTRRTRSETVAAKSTSPLATEPGSEGCSDIDTVDSMWPGTHLPVINLLQVNDQLEYRCKELRLPGGLAFTST